jgi:predicted dehydrogenase
MADKIRVGLVGANAETGSWGARAHVPALQTIPDFEIKAICTAHEETAVAAAKAFGADLPFHDYNQMFAHPDVDLVSVAVRVPYHHEIVMAALKAGKNVFCEWPLGANVRQAEEMVEAGESRSLFTQVGLQGRSDPALMYARDLIAQGYVGEVVACNMDVLSGGGGAEITSDRAWRADRKAGANTLTIAGGHSIDALCYLLGEFAEVSGKVATKVSKLRVRDTGQEIEATSPDNILASGVLESGALASVHVASLPYNGSGWRLEIYGRDGTLYITAPTQAWGGPNTLRGSQGREPLAELPVPDKYVLMPEGSPTGSPYNVGQSYIRLADAMHANKPGDPDFRLALTRHRLLEAIQQSSDEGRTVKVPH